MDIKKEDSSLQPTSKGAKSPASKTRPTEVAQSGSRYNAKAYSDPPGGSPGPGQPRGHRKWRRALVGRGHRLECVFLSPVSFGNFAGNRYDHRKARAPNLCGGRECGGYRDCEAVDRLQQASARAAGTYGCDSGGPGV
jgi:hypothetical protein